MEHDAVEHPSHYTAGSVESIDAIKASMSAEAFAGFCKGSAMQYMWRYDKKGHQEEDLLKARWYLNRLIDQLHG